MSDKINNTLLNILHRYISRLCNTASRMLPFLLIFAVSCTNILYLKSGSMAPRYPAGSLIITSPLLKPRVGSVCAYNHNGMTVVHRIIAESEGGYITQGDANNTSDPYPVLPDDIEGIMLIGIPPLF